MTEKPPAEQLQMVWPQERLGDPPQPHLNPGYSLRTYQPGDEPAWYELMSVVGWPEWDEEKLKPWLARILPEAWFMVIHAQSGQIVASAMGVHNHSDQHPFGGELSWVCANPAHAGQGLGLAVCAAVTRRLISAGYRDIHLKTDDFRMPALKTYFKLGYVPFLYLLEMRERWRAICEQLAWPFTPEAWEPVQDQTA